MPPVAPVAPPSTQYIEDNLPELFRHYKDRNEMMREMREHISGTNPIKAPKTARYQVQKLHMYFLRSYLNERLARFLQSPRYRILPQGSSDPAATLASELEKALQAAIYWIRRGRDDFGKLVSDVLMVDGGAMRWEMNAQAAWPRLIPNAKDGEDDITRGMPTGLEGRAKDDADRRRKVAKANRDRAEAREDHKKSLSAADLSKLLVHTHVPYDAFMPFPDSDVPEEVVEIEFRSLRKVISNPLFSAEVRDQLKAMGKKEKASFRNQVALVRYCDKNIYAYYVIMKLHVAESENDANLLKNLTESEGPISTVKLLHWYEHSAGRPLYTHFGGMHGGWGPGDNTLVKSKIRAMMDLNTAIDELASQGFTNLRELYWPTLLITYADERPDAPLNDNDPKKIIPKGGTDLELYPNEKVEPMFQPRDNPLFNNMWDRLENSMSKIGGAPGLYGVHQSGVEGGYQEAQLRQQADSQFARIEGGIVTGVVDDIIVFFSLIRAHKEKVWVRSHQRNRDGNHFYEDLCIDPEKHLNPMPEIDAVVKASDPNNEAVALRNFQTATTPTNGPGTAAMTRNKARGLYLNDEQPDDTDVEVKSEALMDALWVEVSSEHIKRRLALRTIQETLEAETPPIDPMAQMTLDPELASMMGPFLGGEAPPTDPMAAPVAPMGPPNAAGMQGTGGGLPEGLAQPEATAGRTDQMMMMPPL